MNDQNLHPKPESDIIYIERSALEQQHRTLIAYLNTIRKALGYPPLPTAKQQRRNQRNSASR